MPALLAILGLFLATTPRAVAQHYPLLDSATTNLIAAEISGDAAYDHVRVLTQYHRPQGSDTIMVAARYVERMANAYGLRGVRVLTLPSRRTPWNPGTSDLWIVGGRPERIASSIQNRIHLADRSRPTDVTADLVDIGAGTAADLARVDVRGKIVLTTGDLNRVMADAVQRGAAAGVVWYPDPYTPSRGYLSFGTDRPNQLPWLTLAQRTIDGRAPTFAFVISLAQGIALRNRIMAAREPVRVRALVQSQEGSSLHPEPWMPLVEAFIPGTDPAAGQDVILTAHLQEEQHSANDDASGIASLLEIGRAITKLVAEGRIPRARRNIRLWWTTENDAERQYFAAHPAVLDTLWVGINQDMVGADQSLDVLRTQDVTRLPASRFHFLNDVMETAVEYMVAGNTSNIAQYRNGHGLYPRPHVAQNGSRHRYNAQAVWYFGDSDHQSLLDAGVPAITFTNSPDRYIHTNEDDLFQIDRTQLGRNAASVALIAYTMASADSAAQHRLGAAVVGRGQQRLGGTMRLALEFIATWPDAAAAWHAATDQLHYGVQRERRAIESLAQVDRTAGRRTAGLLEALGRREAQGMRELRDAFAQRGQAPPSQRPMTAAERELAAVRPVRAGTPADWLAKYEQIGWNVGLNGYMAREVLQAANGERTGLEIARHVAAAAREGGAQYYGAVTPEAVLQLLKNVERVGLYRLR